LRACFVDRCWLQGCEQQPAEILTPTPNVNPNPISNPPPTPCIRSPMRSRW